MENRPFKQSGAAAHPLCVPRREDNRAGCVTLTGARPQAGIRKHCEANEIPLTLHCVDTPEKVKEAPAPFNNLAVFYKGNFQPVDLPDVTALEHILKKQKSGPRVNPMGRFFMPEKVQEASSTT